MYLYEIYYVSNFTHNECMQMMHVWSIDFMILMCACIHVLNLQDCCMHRFQQWKSEGMQADQPQLRNRRLPTRRILSSYRPEVNFNNGFFYVAGQRQDTYSNRPIIGSTIISPKNKRGLTFRATLRSTLWFSFCYRHLTVTSGPVLRVLYQV